MKIAFNRAVMLQHLPNASRYYSNSIVHNWLSLPADDSRDREQLLPTLRQNLIEDLLEISSELFAILIWHHQVVVWAAN